MITVGTLIEQLLNLPCDAKVAVNCQSFEDQQMVRRGASLLSKDEAPYSKNDTVWDWHCLSDDEKIVFIQ